MTAIVIATVAVPKHLVYWGSHGCDKSYPHAGACRCSCGVYLNTHNTYGEETATAKTWFERQLEKAPRCLTSA